MCYGRIVSIRNLNLRSLGQKYDFCTSGPGETTHKQVTRLLPKISSGYSPMASWARVWQLLGSYQLILWVGSGRPQPVYAVFSNIQTPQLQVSNAYAY